MDELVRKIYMFWAKGWIDKSHYLVVDGEYKGWLIKSNGRSLGPVIDIADYFEQKSLGLTE